MQVAVNRAPEILPQQLSGLEIELPAAEEIDVQRVDAREVEERLEAGPGPSGHTAAEELAPPIIGVVAQLDALIRCLDLDEGGIWCHATQRSKKCLRARGEITTDFDEGHDLPIARQRGVQSRERVRDAAPFFDGNTASVSAVDHIPHHRADDADSALR